MTLALEGVRLIDFGQYLAGPFGPMIIGDLGDHDKVLRLLRSVAVGVPVP